MPEIPKFRPPGPEPHFLIGNFPLGSRDPLGLLATWAHQFGDIFYYRAGWIHVYFLNHPDHVESVLLTHHQNFVKDRVIRLLSLKIDGPCFPQALSQGHGI